MQTGRACCLPVGSAPPKLKFKRPSFPLAGQPSPSPSLAPAADVAMPAAAPKAATPVMEAQQQPLHQPVAAQARAAAAAADGDRTTVAAVSDRKAAAAITTLAEATPAAAVSDSKPAASAAGEAGGSQQRPVKPKKLKHKAGVNHEATAAPAAGRTDLPAAAVAGTLESADTAAAAGAGKKAWQLAGDASLDSGAAAQQVKGAGVDGRLDSMLSAQSVGRVQAPSPQQTSPQSQSPQPPVKHGLKIELSVGGHATKVMHPLDAVTNRCPHYSA